MKINKNTVVHCPTNELVEEVVKLMKGLGYNFVCEESFKTVCNKEKDKICLRVVFGIINFDSLDYYISVPKYSIISAEDFLKLHEDGVSEHAPIPIEENSAANIHSDEDYIKYKSVLSEAKSILNGSRQADYGDAVDNFAHIAAVVNSVLRRDDITPDLCCMVHIATKLCREGNRHKRDNLVDLAAYSDIYNQIKERENEKL